MPRGNTEYLKIVGGETDNLNMGAEGIPIAVEVEEAFLRSMLDSSDDVMYAAKADGEIIGIANVSRLKRRMSHRASIGISVRQCAWHSGVGTALMEALLAFAGKTAPERLELGCAPIAAAPFTCSAFDYKRSERSPHFLRSTQIALRLHGAPPEKQRLRQMHYVQAKGILSAGNGMNLYRGCTHGCITAIQAAVCHDPFEDIEVKENALTLLEDALRRKRSACMLGNRRNDDRIPPIGLSCLPRRAPAFRPLRYGLRASHYKQNPTACCATLISCRPSTSGQNAWCR